MSNNSNYYDDTSFKKGKITYSDLDLDRKMKQRTCLDIVLLFVKY